MFFWGTLQTESRHTVPQAGGGMEQGRDTHVGPLQMARDRRRRDEEEEAVARGAEAGGRREEGAWRWQSTRPSPTTS